MTKSVSSTDLANLLGSITASKRGSATAANPNGAAETVAEQALKNLLGAEFPLEGVADFFAEKLGL